VQATLNGKTDMYNEFGTLCAGSAGLKREVRPGHTLSILYARTSRIPSYTELYNSDPTTAGNTALRPEETFTGQIAYDYKKEKLAAGTAFFSRRENRIIDWVKTAGQAQWQSQNLPGQTVNGVESYAALPLNAIAVLKTSYAYTFKHTHNDGLSFKYGPNYSRHLASAGAEFAFPWGTQELRMTYKKKPGRDGWFLLDGYFSRNLGKTATAFLSVKNVFNSGYQEIDGVPQPGREVSVGLKLEW
jgi:vitamin B12 transporter